MVKYRSLIILISILSAVIVSGCATKEYTSKFYSGENRPTAELATITTFHESNFFEKTQTDVFIIEIDGKLIENYNINKSKPTYEILPGEHKLKLGFFIYRNMAQARHVDPINMSFAAQAGHAYITKGNFPKTISAGQIIKSFWIEDINSKQVVAEERFHEIDVPGTAANSQLQKDITQTLIEEASKNHGDCGHIVLKADAYKATEPSVIVIEMGGDAPALAKSLRAEDLMFVEKWFLKSCETVNIYEVLLWKSGTGTDIMVKRLDTGE
jgi:hypothetical protein